MALKDITLGQYFPGNSIVHRLRQMGVDIDPSVYTIDQARQAILAKLKKEGK